TNMRKRLFMKTLISTVLVLGLACSPSLAQSATGKAQKTEKATSKQENQPDNNQAYLGLAVMPLSPAWRSQLPTVLPKGEGVMVLDVTKDSPAAKAGLQQYDILLTFGKEKLSSPREFAELVHRDRAGQQVAIDFVRGGKLDHCQV